MAGNHVCSGNVAGSGVRPHEHVEIRLMASRSWVRRIFGWSFGIFGWIAQREVGVGSWWWGSRTRRWSGFRREWCMPTATSAMYRGSSSMPEPPLCGLGQERAG